MACAAASGVGVQAAIPGGTTTGVVISQVNPKGVVGLRPSLKGLMPARLRLPVTARSRFPPCSFPFRSASATRPGPAWSCKPKTRSGSSGTERRSVACGLRQPAPGRRFTGPQASCDPARAAMRTGNDRKRDVAKMRACRRDATVWR